MVELLLLIIAALVGSLIYVERKARATQQRMGFIIASREFEYDVLLGVLERTNPTKELSNGDGRY